jgi:hypothetical protein
MSHSSPTPLTSRNRTAAKTVALAVDSGLLPDAATAREIMEALGLIEPGGRNILPDPRDLLVDPSADDFLPMGRGDPGAEVKEPPLDRRFVPAGLRELGPKRASDKIRPTPTPRPVAKPRAANGAIVRDTCGTPRGYRVHLRLHEKTCDACRAAEVLRKKREHEPESVGRPRTKEIEHGTYSGYTKERRRGMEHCRPCLDAANARRSRNKVEQRKRARWARERRPANPDQIVYDLTRQFENWLADSQAAEIAQRAAAARVRNALFELRIAVNGLERAEMDAAQPQEKRTA